MATKTEGSKSNGKTEQETGLDLDKYFDGLEKTGEQVAANMADARARNGRIMDEVIATTLASQKDMLNLNREVTTSPTDYRKNLGLTLDVLMKFQERSLQLSKSIYKEQSELAAKTSAQLEEAFGEMNYSKLDPFAPYKKVAEFWKTTVS